MHYMYQLRIWVKISILGDLCLKWYDMECSSAKKPGNTCFVINNPKQFY